MLVLLLLPSSCDLNIKHRRKISPPRTLPRLHSRPPPASPPGWAQLWGWGGHRRWAPSVPEGPPLHTHNTQVFSSPFPSQFPSGFSISACLGRGIVNPLRLHSSGAEKGRSSPRRYLLGSGDCKASFCFSGERKLGMFWLIKSDLPFSSACGGVRNLFSSGTTIPGCQPTVQRQKQA